MDIVDSSGQYSNSGTQKTRYDSFIFEEQLTANPSCPAMPAPQVYQLHVGPIIAFSFNSDESKVAISPNTTDLDIYAKKGAGYTKMDTLGDVFPSTSTG